MFKQLTSTLEKIKSRWKRTPKNLDLDSMDAELSSPPPKRTWKEALNELATKVSNPKFDKAKWEEGLNKTKSFLLNSGKNIKQKNWRSLLFSGSGEWDKKIQKILFPESRQAIQFVFLISMALLLPYQLGKIIGLGIKGRPTIIKKSPVAIQRPNLNPEIAVQSIRVANAFRVKLDEQDSIDKDKKVDEICLEGKGATSLPIQLLSTSVLQDSVKSLASVQLRGSPEILNFRVGDKIQHIARVEKIDRLKLHLKNLESGGCEFVESKDKLLQSAHNFSVLDRRKGMDLIDSLTPNGIKNDGNAFDIECSFFQNKLKDMGSILTQAKGVPITNPDGTLSFKIEDVVPDGVFAHLGIQSDDMITKINGKNIQNLNEVMNLFGRLSTIQKFEISVMRGSLEQTFNYQVSNCPNPAPSNQTKANP